MLSRRINPAMLQQDKPLGAKKKAAGLPHLADYLRLEASPAEKEAYNAATLPGTKAGTAPRTIAQLHAFMNR